MSRLYRVSHTWISSPFLTLPNVSLLSPDPGWRERLGGGWGLVLSPGAEVSTLSASSRTGAQGEFSGDASTGSSANPTPSFQFTSSTQHPFPGLPKHPTELGSCGAKGRGISSGGLAAHPPSSPPCWGRGRRPQTRPCCATLGLVSGLVSCPQAPVALTLARILGLGLFFSSSSDLVPSAEEN